MFFPLNSIFQQPVNEIEAYFRGKHDLPPLQISSQWWSGYGEQSMRKIAFYPIVMLPHVLTTILSVSLLGAVANLT